MDWNMNMLPRLLMDTMFPEGSLDDEVEEALAEWWLTMQEEEPNLLMEEQMHRTQSLFNYILTDVREDIDAAVAGFDGTNFEEMVRTYDHREYIRTVDELPQLPIQDFTFDFGLESETVEMLLALDENQISEVIDLGDWYLLLHVAVQDMPSLEEIEEEISEWMRSDIAQGLREDRFWDTVTGWVDAVDVNINQRALDRMKR
jgi:hypothetical protein